MVSPLSPSIQQSYRYATDLTRNSGSNFCLSFRMLPAAKYRAMCVIYAYMRLSDDVVDGPSGVEGFDLNHWRSVVEQAVQGQELSSHPLFPALHDVLMHYPIKSEWLLAVLDGMQTDLEGIAFETDRELRTYCNQVAGMSGLCCQAIWGSDLEQTHDLALLCGEAFQMTNILRDLREDADRGRCYLSQEMLSEWDCHASDLNQVDRLPTQWRPMLQAEIMKVSQLYAQASQLEQHLSGSGLRMFRLMFLTYRALFEQIAADVDAAFRQRVKLSRWKKGLIVWEAFAKKLVMVSPKYDVLTIDPNAKDFSNRLVQTQKAGN